MDTADAPRAMQQVALKVCRSRSNAYAAMWSVGHLGFHHGSRLRAALQAHLEHSICNMSPYRQHKRRAQAQPEDLGQRKRSRKNSAGSPSSKRVFQQAVKEQSIAPIGLQLIQAAAAGGITQLAQLAQQQNADVNQQVAPLGRTALHAAAEAGQAACCQFLLEQLGADPYVYDNEGLSAVMLAARNGHHQVIEVLLAAGADPFAVNHSGANALLLAASCGSSESVKLLLHEGFVDADYHNSDLGAGEHALLLAAEGGWCECVQLLLKAGARVNRADKEGRTALWVASRNGHVDAIRMLLAQPRIKHIRHYLTNTTPLQEAQQAGHKTVVALLQANLRQQQQPESMQHSALGSGLTHSHKQLLKASIQPWTQQHRQRNNHTQRQQQQSMPSQKSRQSQQQIAQERLQQVSGSQQPQKATRTKCTNSSISGVSTVDVLFQDRSPIKQVKKSEADTMASLPALSAPPAMVC